MLAVRASAGATAEGGHWACGAQACGEVRVQQARGGRSGTAWLVMALPSTLLRPHLRWV